MPLNLPHYSSDPILQRIHVYSSIDSPALRRSTQQAGNRAWDLAASDGSSLRFFASPDDAEGPNCVNFYLESTRVGSAPSEYSDSELAEMHQAIADFNGIKTQSLLKATYRIPKASMPKRGIVPALRQSMMVGDSTVIVSGATVAVGGSLQSRITWEVIGEDESLAVDVVTIEEIEFSDDLLIEAAAMLRERLDAIVFLALPGAS